MKGRTPLIADILTLLATDAATVSHDADCKENAMIDSPARQAERLVNQALIAVGQPSVPIELFDERVVAINHGELLIVCEKARLLGEERDYWAVIHQDQGTSHPIHEKQLYWGSSRVLAIRTAVQFYVERALDGVLA